MNGSKSPTTTTATTSSNNRSHIDPPLQIAAEQDLAQEFLSILQGHHRDIQRSSPPPSVAAGHGVADDDSLAGISVAERKILSRVSYQNWTAGCCAGALTFGLLVGLSRRAAARRYRLPQRAAAALRDLDVTTTTTKRRAVAGPRPQRGSSNSTMGQPSSQNETAMDPTSLRSDVMSEVQFMVYGATSIVVTIMTSWYLADRDEFHRQVGRLPLSAGKSRLCHEACPALVEHYRQLMTLQQQQTMPQQQQQQHLQESLRRPQTIELDSMLQLVLNCQQRLQFVADQRVQRQLPSHVLVDVARPGVPFNYLGIPVVDGRSRSDESGMADNDATIREDDGVVVEEEYDWLRKLVLDR